jgi:broad specificity phosphatase PhoE
MMIMMQSLWLVILLTATSITNFALGETAPSGDTATVVLLVRHAEKAVGPGDDPPLTPEGRCRAKALATALRDARPTTIITTQLQRTIQTAQPSAASAGINPERVPIDSSNISQNVGAITAVVRNHLRETILIVGHNTTVPAVIAALGGPQLPIIPDAEYDKLFVLILGKDVRLVQSRYGAPSSSIEDCG